MLDLRNDYYGGITLPRIFNSWGTFSSSVPAIKVIENINEVLNGNNTDIKSKQKLEDILNRLSEGDNDVVFVGRLKQAER